MSVCDKYDKQDLCCVRRHNKLKDEESITNPARGRFNELKAQHRKELEEEERDYVLSAIGAFI